MKVNISKLERKRERLKMTRQAFSVHLGMQESNYAKILKYETSTLKRLTRIGEILGIDPKELLI